MDDLQTWLGEKDEEEGVPITMGRRLHHHYSSVLLLPQSVEEVWWLVEVG